MLTVACVIAACVITACVITVCVSIACVSIARYISSRVNHLRATTTSKNKWAVRDVKLIEPFAYAGRHFADLCGAS